MFGGGRSVLLLFPLAVLGDLFELLHLRAARLEQRVVVRGGLEQRVIVCALAATAKCTHIRDKARHVSGCSVAVPESDAETRPPAVAASWRTIGCAVCADLLCLDLAEMHLVERFYFSFVRLAQLRQLALVTTGRVLLLRVRTWRDAGTTTKTNSSEEQARQ